MEPRVVSSRTSPRVLLVKHLAERNTDDVDARLETDVCELEVIMRLQLHDVCVWSRVSLFSFCPFSTFKSMFPHIVSTYRKAALFLFVVFFPQTGKIADKRSQSHKTQITASHIEPITQ